MTEVIHVEIRFDSMAMSSSFTSQEAAKRWVVETLTDLLSDEYDLLRSSMIQVRRT